MVTQKVSKRFSRLFSVVIACALAFFQVASLAGAEGTPPPGAVSKDIPPISLGEIQDHYGPLGEMKGPTGVVVELEDTPAALLYARDPGSLRTRALTASQVALIQEKQTRFMNDLQAMRIVVTEFYRTQRVYNGIWLRVDAGDIKKLASTPGVKALHPILPQTVNTSSSVPLIGAPQVWGGLPYYQGDLITIGVIDSGIDYIHTNFDGGGDYTGQDFTTLGEPGNLFPTAKVVGGWDFAGDAYNGNVATSTPLPDPDPMDCMGHGSAVAGIVAGSGVNFNGSAYVEAGADTYAALKDLTAEAYIAKFRIGPGVAPKADLYSLRVFGCTGSTFLAPQALEWAMDPNGDGLLIDHLDVINISIGNDFKSEYDPMAVAANNTAQAGVIVVASAGNDNDVYYILGAPGVASNAITVAGSWNGTSLVNAFEVTATSAASPLVPPGLYPGSYAEFGPQTYSQAGNLAYDSPIDLGCTAYTGTPFSGKITLINRGTCDFVVKVKNAQNAGALGVLIANTDDTVPFAPGGTDATIIIPAMMTTKSIGDALKADMAAGAVDVLLTTAHPRGVIMRNPLNADVIASYSSRGPARAGTLLKPDIAAPSSWTFVAANGTGNQGRNDNGTSVATPHVAGAMALLKQIHPAWTVAELKALVMNTATNDVWMDTAHSARETPTRVGAGRVNVANAALSSVIAYNTANPEQVSLSFGEQEVLGTQTFVKSITIKNTGVLFENYNVAFSESYQSNPGLTFTLLDAKNAPLGSPVFVPPFGTAEIKIQVSADASKLTRAHDASIATSSTYGNRSFFSEAGGYLTLTSATQTLRVPVHIAARPASDMRVAEKRIQLPAAATGTFNLMPTGTPVSTTDDTSLVAILELMDISPNEPSSSNLMNAVDLHYIGAASDYPTYAFADSAMYFGIATYGKWDTPNSLEFDIYIDANEDGTYDYIVINSNAGLYSGTTDDVMVASICTLPDWTSCHADYYTNKYDGTINTNIFNNNVVLLPVKLTSIGLVEGDNTDFHFFIQTHSQDGVGIADVSDVMSYDVAHQAFKAVDTVHTGRSIWLDAPAFSPTFAITYDKAAFLASHSKGLLLLHLHNQAGNTAEVVPVFTDISFLPLIRR
jgi:subtilisin family serine protease